jgi:hypothetical protein
MNYFETAESFANENYSNYSGSEWNNFVDAYAYADGGAEQDIASSLPFVININNSTTADVSSVVVLNANTAGNASAPAYGNNSAITITMDNGDITYAEFLQDIKSSPFKVGQIYLQSANASQPFKALTIKHRESNGIVRSIPVSPRVDPMQNQSGVTIVKYQFPVNAYTSITTTILASATLTMSLYPSEQINVARSLSGQDVTKAYARPSLSQLQIPNGRPLVG